MSKFLSRSKEGHFNYYVYMHPSLRTTTFFQRPSDVQNAWMTSLSDILTITSNILFYIFHVYVVQHKKAHKNSFGSHNWHCNIKLEFHFFSKIWMSLQYRCFNVYLRHLYSVQIADVKTLFYSQTLWPSSTNVHDNTLSQRPFDTNNV